MIKFGDGTTHLSLQNNDKSFYATIDGGNIWCAFTKTSENRRVIIIGIEIKGILIEYTSLDFLLINNVQNSLVGLSNSGKDKMARFLFSQALSNMTIKDLGNLLIEASNGSTNRLFS